MDEPLRMGLVGAGAIAQSYFKALDDASFATWVGVADVRPEAVAAAAETLRCPGYASYQDLAEKAECDAVVICTPPVTHTEIALFFIERGIAVLCEKPLSIDIDSAQAIVDAAEKRGVVMAMASKFRYVDDVIRARSIIASGVLGDIVLLENAFTSSVNMAHRWNADPKTSGGGVLIDNGTHSVDITRYLLGPIDRVCAIEGKRMQTPAVEDTANMFLHTVQDANATVDLSWTLNKELPTFINVYGSNGVIQVGWKESRFRQTSSPDWISFGRGYDKVSAFQKQMSNFCNRVLNREPLLISAEEAVASVAVIQAAYQSLAEGGWVDVAQPKAAERKVA